jgi:hypothetical protein
VKVPGAGFFKTKPRTIPKFFTGGYIAVCVKSMGYRGAETPVTPDEPDVIDGGDGVEGLVGKGMVSSTSGGGKLLIIGVK